MKSKSIRTILVSATLVVVLLMGSFSAEACSRIVYHGLNGIVLTARSMDWVEDMGTHLWAFPRGMERDGRVGSNSLKWTSKYGSVIASGYDVSTTDGMNEKGLVANALWLAESVYPQWDGQNEQRPGLSIAAWVQYVLDNFATVDAAVQELKKERFAVVTASAGAVDGLTTLHLSLSDASGDSAILEYIGGKLVIHHDRSFTVMTNSPTFSKQLALYEYWQEIGGAVMLPGTSRAADRFVRGAFYINGMPKVENIEVALAYTFSVIRNMSAPFGIKDPLRPNVSATRWRTVADHKNKLYFFESTERANVFWVSLNKLDFSPSAPVRKLTISSKKNYAGETSEHFESAAPFEFAGL